MTDTKHPTRLLFSLVTGAVVTAICLGALEIGLRLRPLCLSPICADTVYGRLGNKWNPDIDALGFRNADVPDSTCVVFFGDSQVFGTGVGRESTFARQVHTTHGIPSYNMGLSGTSILNQAQMLELALKVKPKVAYLSFYAGNDLLDLFTEVTGEGSIAASELHAYDLKAGPYSSHFEYQELWDSVRASAVPYLSGVQYSPLRAAFKSMQRRVAVFKTLMGLRKTFLTRQKHGDIKSPKEMRVDDGAGVLPGTDTFYLKNAMFHDIFDNEFRVLAVDRRRPEIRDSVSNTIALLRQSAERLASSGVEPRVLFLPTKETVFYEYLEATNIELPRSFHETVSNERHIHYALQEALDGHAIHYLKVVEALSREVVSGKNAYLFFDGHPNTYGHSIIAKTIADDLEGMPCERGKRTGVDDASL